MIMYRVIFDSVIPSVAARLFIPSISSPARYVVH